MKLLSSCVILFVLGIGAAAGAEQATPLQRLSGHVYALAGATNASPSANGYGANVGVVVGRDGVLVIDTLISARHAQRLAEASGPVQGNGRGLAAAGR